LSDLLSLPAERGEYDQLGKVIADERAIIDEFARKKPTPSSEFDADPPPMVSSLRECPPASGTKHVGGGSFYSVDEGSAVFMIGHAAAKMAHRADLSGPCASRVAEPAAEGGSRFRFQPAVG
jgi:hypothetical protein